MINKLKNKILNLNGFVTAFIFALLSSFNTNVSALEKIEGGDITIEALGNIIKNLGTKIQVFGVVLSFIALVIFVIQFIIGDDETKQRKKKTIIYTVIGLVLLILVPSIINFIIDTVK